MRLPKLAAPVCAGAVATIACTALLVAGAGASRGGDLPAVLEDFLDFPHYGDVTACLFTEKQLEHAKGQLLEISGPFTPDFTDFEDEIDHEIKRWKRGGCSGKASSGGLWIVAAKGKGSARRESVALENAGSKRVKLGGYALRDRAGEKIRLRTVRLAVGSTLRVITGCATGKSEPSRQGSFYYACRKKHLWSDKGDVVELLSRGDKVLARRRTT